MSRAIRQAIKKRRNTIKLSFPELNDVIGNDSALIATMLQIPKQSIESGVVVCSAESEGITHIDAPKAAIMKFLEQLLVENSMNEKGKEFFADAEKSRIIVLRIN